MIDIATYLVSGAVLGFLIGLTGVGGGVQRLPTSLATLSVRNSIITGNVSGGGAPDCAGTLSSLGFVLLGNSAACTVTGLRP